MALKLGSFVRDKISGFTGITTSRSEFLYGCVRCQVTPKELHEGKPVEAQWFDEDQLEVVPQAKGEPGNPGSRRGGPRDDARRATDAPR